MVKALDLIAEGGVLQALLSSSLALISLERDKWAAVRLERSSKGSEKVIDLMNGVRVRCGGSGVV
jgi:hypothetical protein